MRKSLANLLKFTFFDFRVDLEISVHDAKPRLSIALYRSQHRFNLLTGCTSRPVRFNSSNEIHQYPSKSKYNTLNALYHRLSPRTR